MEENAPLLPPVSSADIAAQIQQLSKLVLDVEKGLSMMGGIRDTSTFRKEQHEQISYGMDLGHQIAQNLQRYSEKNKNKLLLTFNRELKKLQALGRELSIKEKQTMARMSSSDLTSNLERDSHNNSDFVPKESVNQSISASIQIVDPELAYIDDRQMALRDIQQDVKQLNEMMKDMATLVDGQQEQIDRIEVNIDRVNQSVKQGETELNEASRHQKKSRSWLCYLLLILAIGFLILLFVLIVPKL